MPDNITDTVKAEDAGPMISFLGFADNKVPEFREVGSKEWVMFGEDNLFPEHILYLFNKSSNHNAIIGGKVNYILGKGIVDNNVKINDDKETLFKVLEKICFDIELNAGCYLQCVWKKGGGSSWTHLPFENLRKSKDGKGYWYSKNWKKLIKNNPVFIPNFNPDQKKGAQVLAYSEYRPGCGAYPLPGYFGALNDIETDVEISKYNLSVIKNGMFGSKMISFFNGEPTKEAKRKIEDDFKKKYVGSENSGRFMLVFNTDPTKAPQVQDLSTTDLDKLFDQLGKTTQAKLFSGHQVTSPMLFGIMEPGKLGGRNELQDAYEIFKNTYINKKQMAMEEIIDFIAPFIGIESGQKIIPVEPIGVQVNPIDFKEMLPKAWVLDKLGIDQDDYPDDNVSGVTSTQTSSVVNENLKNLTGRQTQNIERIIRKYKNGRISKPMAETLLKSGLGLSPEDISTFLNFAAIESEDEVSEMFETIGIKREEFIIVKSKAAKFEKELFADVTGNDASIIDLIRKDKRITPEIIAQTIKEPVEYVEARIKSLTKRGILTSKISTIGTDTIIEHAVNTESIDKIEKPETVDISIRYSYEPKPGLDPIIATTRAFCRKLIGLDRLYTRSEIESISQRVGYSVWDRKGGFWGDSYECRHRWVANVIIKKRK